jgi:hypothetical protein
VRIVGIYGLGPFNSLTIKRIKNPLINVRELCV